MTIWHIVIALSAFACWIYETVSHDIQELQRCRAGDQATLANFVTTISAYREGKAEGGKS